MESFLAISLTPSIMVAQLFVYNSRLVQQHISQVCVFQTPEGYRALRDDFYNNTGHLWHTAVNSKWKHLVREDEGPMATGNGFIP